MRLNHLRAWAVRHPRVTDGCLAGLVAAIALPVTIGGSAAPGVLEPGTGVTGASWLWFVAVHVPLGWRRRTPAIVFWSVLGVAVACVLSGVTGVFLVFAPLCALYAVARHRPPRLLVPAVAGLGLVLGLALLRDRPASSNLIGILSLVVVTTLAGVLVRQRLAYLAERDRRRREEVEHRTRLTVTAERAQIAREVHDIVAHNLAVMVALTEGAAHTAETDPRRTVDMLDKASTAGRSALGDMRRLVGLLRDGSVAEEEPPPDDERRPPPGLADLDELVAQVRAAGVRVALSHDGRVDGWGAGLGLAVYRIVQEALTNTLKHAGPHARAHVRLRATADGLDLEIVDDGAGRPAAAPAGGGNGLVGIAERAAAYGGTVESGPTTADGWRVHARFPAAGSDA
jgi:signal transduction histidine kinase